VKGAHFGYGLSGWNHLAHARDEIIARLAVEHQHQHAPGITALLQ
jgi:hypothetical protein